MELQCHLATHNKPFKCPMCEQAFLVEFLLDKHLQHVHSGAGSGETGGMKDAGEVAKTKVRAYLLSPFSVSLNEVLAVDMVDIYKMRTSSINSP